MLNWFYYSSTPFLGLWSVSLQRLYIAAFENCSKIVEYVVADYLKRQPRCIAFISCHLERTRSTAQDAAYMYRHLFVNSLLAQALLHHKEVHVAVHEFSDARLQIVLLPLNQVLLVKWAKTETPLNLSSMPECPFALFAMLLWFDLTLSISVCSLPQASCLRIQTFSFIICPLDCDTSGSWLCMSELADLNLFLPEWSESLHKNFLKAAEF